MGNGRHVTTDVPPSIVYARVEQGEEGRLYQLAGAQTHQLCILARDTELDRVEVVKILEEGACVRKYLTRRLPLQSDKLSIGEDIPEQATYVWILNR